MQYCEINFGTPFEYLNYRNKHQEVNMKRFSLIILIMLLAISSNVFGQNRKKIRKFRSKQIAKRVVPVPEIGFRYGYVTTFKNSYAGVHIWMPLNRKFYLTPSLDYLFDWAGTQYKGNVELILVPSWRSPFYLGGGLALHYKKISGNTGETNPGSNLFVGLKFMPRSSIKPYVQAQWTSINGEKSHFHVLAGLNFRIR